MRLLETLPNGDFCLTRKLLDDAIPQYAILSHTWGDDSQEVTFEDMVGGSGRGKAGYKKIQFCGDQAARDGLRYFWVDSCCIKKSSDAELSESLNSMFRWYQRAEKCYVYLSDVSTGKDKRDKNLRESWEEAFRESRWFTRGWTLQELLAPASVQFFSEGGSRLGDKQFLEQQIHEITEIPILALRGSALSQFSAKQKFGWAKNRKTTREEDWAYSLLGVFEISMPVIYGEGRRNAVRRLEKEIDDASKVKQCLRDLRVTDPHADKVRIEETKGGLLADSYHWILENLDFKQWRNDQQSHLLWIKGDPGKGKTMLLCGIINELKRSTAETHLLAFFYCQATDSRINNATAVLRGLLYLLIDQQPSLISHIQKQHDLAGKTLFEDVNAWTTLSDIFTKVLQDPSLKSTYLIIDALDECTVDQPKLLDFIVQKSSVGSVKWLVSSRNDANIERRLQLDESGIRLSLELKDNAEQISCAVDAYIEYCLSELAEIQCDKLLQDSVRERMQRKANGTFLWVSLIMKELKEAMSWEILQVLDEVPMQLKDVYRRMIEQIKQLRRQYPKLCQQVLSTVITAYRPLHLQELYILSGLPTQVQNVNESTAKIVKMCGSFLTIRDDNVYIIHQSARDFLSTEASSDIFPYGIGNVHHSTFSRSLQVMSNTLRRDFYSLSAPGYHIERVKQPDPDPLAASRYSCIYWVNHLCAWTSHSCVDQGNYLQDGGAVDEFLRKKYLYWLEALSLCKSMSNGVVSMAKLDALLQGRSDSSALLELVQDARRFIMYHKQAIQISPLQAYASALIFSPCGSQIRRHFKMEEPKWITIKPAIKDKWGACLQTLEGHSSWVWSVAFSHDSTRLASASDDKTVKIWDTSSGECLQTLEGHSSSVRSVAFSHDSTRLATASHDNTVKIWDASSGECLQTLEGHRREVWSVAFSHDSARLASSSHDYTVKIWDASSGECLQTLENYSSFACSVAFSHDSARLASASTSHYRTVKIWDTSSGECLQTLKGHSSWAWSVAFSHDSARLASASDDKTVKIWNTSSGECLQTLEGHSSSVYSSAFSHDSARHASASRDNTVKIWDTSSGECLQTLEGHSRGIWSVAFSHDSTRLASASVDNTVKIWDVSSGEYLQTHEGHSSWGVYSVAFSHDSARLASASHDSTVKIWDTSSGECLQTLEGHRREVWSVAFSHDSARLASASDDCTVKIWDASSGKCLQTLKDHKSSVHSVAFSHDSARLASASHDNTVKTWDASSGECLRTLEGHRTRVWSVAFSHDSARLASASRDNLVKIWDASSGECLQTLEGHSSAVRSVAFSHDSARLATASHDNTVKIWDVSSGEYLQTLEIGKALFNISFDTTGSYLHTDIGTIGLEESSSLLNRAPSVTDSTSPRYEGWALSSDGEWITYNSKNWVWLPSEYRPSCSATFGETIGIGVGTGKVWICNLKVDNL